MPLLHLTTQDRLYFDARGRGRPVVFVHGWSMCHAFWAAQVEHLQHVCRTVVYDQRGHGHSHRPHGPYSMEAYSQDLGELLRGLELDDVVLVGWSMGVIVALEYFRRTGGAHVGKLVLLSGSPRLLGADDWPHGFDPAELRTLAQALAADRAGATRAFLGAMMTEATRAALLDEVTRVALDVPLAIAVESFQSELAADLRHVLAGIEVPTLVVHGDEDHPTCLGAAAFMLGQLPRGQHLVLPHAAHFGPLEAADELNLALEHFVVDEARAADVAAPL